MPGHRRVADGSVSQGSSVVGLYYIHFAYALLFFLVFPMPGHRKVAGGSVSHGSSFVGIHYLCTVHITFALLFFFPMPGHGRVSSSSSIP